MDEPQEKANDSSNESRDTSFDEFDPLYPVGSLLPKIKGAPPIAADPGGIPDFLIFRFFEKCGFLEFSGGIWGLGGFAMDWKWLWASNGRILSPFRTI